MKEQKKGVKQATISAFFSPTKSGEESDDHGAESELKTIGAKRRRISSPAATSQANTSVKTMLEKPAKSPAKKKVEDKSKAKAKASFERKKKKKQPVRFISPHAVAGDDAEDEDLDDEDVFITPEAKRARAELDIDGELVPAGALISDDALVNEKDIVDVSDDSIATPAEKTETVDEDTATDTFDLTRATSEDAAAAESAPVTDDKKKKIQKKAAKSPLKTKCKVAIKTTTKRQQKMKEKAAAAVAIANPASVEPLDPVAQARVDTYKMKMDELTRMYSELSLSKQESDAIMQDIYGARLDCNLDVTVDLEKARQALAETWKRLRDHVLSTMNTLDAISMPTIVEFPHEIKCLIVKGIQGRSASLSVVCGELLAEFKQGYEASDVDMEAPEKKSAFDIDTVDRAASLAMEMEIKMLGQRTPHGVRPAKANVFEDTSVAALWVWEVGSLEKYFGDEAQKIVKRMRKHRKRLGQQLRTLARLVQLLHQKPIDEAKVSAEEAKVGKFGFIVAAELQKAKERETKELEKRNVTEEKKRFDLERQDAKSEEKRKRDREVEEKELESFKAQKKFKSFFATAAANSVEVGGSVMDMTGDNDAEKTADLMENKSTKIARMDATITFLGFAGAVSTLEAVVPPQQSIFLSLKHKRNGTRHADPNYALGLSGRRHRDPKFGVMKLLQFHENNRPAYYGTFSTRSQLFRVGRRPFTRYSKFDYTIDSDDEWEEEEPGESLSDDENDADESDEDNLDYDDQWLAYEDEVDYMDDAGEEVDLTECSEGPLSPTKHKLPSQLQKKRLKAKTVKPAKLEPQILGPFWVFHDERDNCTKGHFPGPVGELLIEPVFESSLLRKAREYEEEQKRVLEQEKLQAQEKKTQEVKQKTTDPGAAEKIAAEVKKSTKASSPLEKTKAPRPSASPGAASASPSPVKVPNPIDSWFKKVSDPVPPLSKPPASPVAPNSEKSPTVKVMSVD